MLSHGVLIFISLTISKWWWTLFQRLSGHFGGCLSSLSIFEGIIVVLLLLSLLIFYLSWVLILYLMCKSFFLFNMTSFYFCVSFFHQKIFLVWYSTVVIFLPFLVVSNNLKYLYSYVFPNAFHEFWLNLEIFILVYLCFHWMTQVWCLLAMWSWTNHWIPLRTILWNINRINIILNLYRYYMQVKAYLSAINSMTELRTLT